MGLIIDINERVSIELRRESFALIVDDAHVDQSEGSARIEMDYRDAEAVNAALFKLLKADAYLLDFPRRHKLPRGDAE